MSGELLTTGPSSTVQCTHQGLARPTGPGDRRVTVGGEAVVPASTGYTITGCTLPPPNAGNGPCASNTPPWSPTTQRVKASGQPLLQRESSATTAPSGTPLRVSATQGRVRAS
ncbi:hypothetical protein [Actinomycetospora cinnamomea]|uniref:Uncharacterized protein n=1 Tax=Actinomycetospora cinnamomea TaxID=663609 RepID=A0A2U1F7R3_9PSEU|nr:hypothetical protein [Actinomycetospora cinnamomea]PVZ08202.1 hypothetical protein C8D89_10985 [Actinomycetospora cinnamomea]